MDALTWRLNSNDIHPFSKLRQLKSLRINHLFDLRLIDTPVLMHVPNVSTYIQINVNTVLLQRVQEDGMRCGEDSLPEMIRPAALVLDNSFLVRQFAEYLGRFVHC